MKETDEIKKTLKSVDRKLKKISDTLQDLSMKVCHLIRKRKSYWDTFRGDEFPS